MFLLFKMAFSINPNEGGLFSHSIGRVPPCWVETVQRTFRARMSTFLIQINQKWSQMTADIITDLQSTWKMPNVTQFFSEAAQKYPSLSVKFSWSDTYINFGNFPIFCLHRQYIHQMKAEIILNSNLPSKKWFALKFFFNTHHKHQNENYTKVLHFKLHPIR